MISKSYLIIIGLAIALSIIIIFIIFFAKEIFTTSLQYIPTILGAIGTAYGLFERIQRYMQKSSSNNINDFKDLWLFSAQWLGSDYSSLFVSHSSDSLPDQMFSQWTKDIMKRKVTIRSESENARVPKESFTDTLENIISNARDMIS